MKLIHRIFYLFFVFTLHGYAQKTVISNSQNRQFTSLNGKWEYILDPYKTGGMGGMAIFKNATAHEKQDRVEYSFNKSHTLWVPGSWNVQRPELKYFEGNVWYKKTFNVANFSSDKRYFIHLGASNYITTVTINGEVLGTHEGGFTPFSFELTDHLKTKGNYIIIGVNNTRKPEYVPSEVTDWFNHGGITRDVKLIEVPKTFVSNYYLTLDKSSLGKKANIIKGKLITQGNVAKVEGTISIPELNVSHKIKINSDGFTPFNFSVKNLELWSPDNPKLYRVKISLGMDSIDDEIGFRTIETKGKQILLNGKPIFLKGICLHDENPFTENRANSIADAKLVLDWVQELGGNFIRLAHYPHQEHLVRLADKRGILLWEELPLYWGIQWGNTKTLENAKAQFKELIDRDFNRASAIIWSIANETASIPERTTFLSELADFVKLNDDTRLISAAIKKDQELDGHPDPVYTYSDPLIDKLDIISINDYLGWYGGLPEECRNKAFKFYANKPVIVSEFGGGALQGFYADKETRWSEEFQENLYKESIQMFDKIEGLAGMTPWILVDFKSPLRQLRGVQDGWNRKGIISEKGKKKKAFYVLKKYYSEK